MGSCANLSIYAFIKHLLPRRGKETIQDLYVSRGEFLGDAKWMVGNWNTAVINLAFIGAFQDNVCKQYPKASEMNEKKEVYMSGLLYV